MPATKSCTPLCENPAGVLLVSDELSGWLGRISRPEHAEERAFALSCWNGKTSHIVDRIGRGTIVVPYCCTSVFGAVTPDKLKSYLAQTKFDSLTADGLMQRFQLSVWADIPSNWEFPKSALGDVVYQQMLSLLTRLIPLDPEVPRVYRFEPHAQELFAEWMEGLMREVRGGSLSSTMQSHLAKYPKLLAALATLFELVENPITNLVSDEQFARAADWCVLLRSHAERIYAAEISPAMRAAALLTKKILERKADQDGILDVRIVYRHHWEGLTEPELVKAACDVLVDAHWLRAIDKPTGGRPANRYQVNPRAWKETV